MSTSKTSTSSAALAASERSGEAAARASHGRRGVVAKNPNIAEPLYPASTLVISAESGCHPFLLRVEQGGVLVVHIADPRIGCVDLQCGFRKGAEQVNGRPFHLVAV